MRWPTMGRTPVRTRAIITIVGDPRRQGAWLGTRGRHGAWLGNVRTPGCMAAKQTGARGYGREAYRRQVAYGCKTYDALAIVAKHS